MPMPRVLSGTAMSASAFNTLAEEIDNLGIACVVRVLTPLTNVSATTDRVVSWESLDMDTYGGMWSNVNPTFVQIPVDGTYTCTHQSRWGYLSGGSPYNTGQRAGKIMVNGTSVFSNSVASDKKAGSTDGEGVTLSMTATIRLHVGDKVYANYWHSAAGNLSQVHENSYGGSYLSVVRQGPIG